MAAIIKQDIPFEKEDISKSEAEKIFSKGEETYKLELLSALEEEKITLYKHGAFVDLCRGPHVSSSSPLGLEQRSS